MKNNKRFFPKIMTAIAVFESLFLVCDFANAATRTTARSVPQARKNISSVTTTEQEAINIEPVAEQVTNEIEEEVETPLILQNKSNQFAAIVSEVMENAGPDNSFAELIRQQREALAASEASYLTTSSQNKALSSNSHSCDVALRKCMISVCGSDFTRCATDGDTVFGDKLNKCKRDTNCSAQEFSLFAKEIKADRDTNVQLAGYNAVLDCGNNYNACIMQECGTTYNKCLGKNGENSAIQKCATIARECAEADSGLSARFGTAIGKLRENAESDIKKDESRLYALRDSMEKQCKSLGAAFDSRTFDCVYTVEFFAGENQSVPLASRKAYAGDSFVCTQEWFGINTTTARENAYRETTSQTAASSAMLGSGVGMAAGAISSGAINRAIETTKAKNELKKAEKELKNAEKEQQKNEQENKDKNDQGGSGLGAIIKDKIGGIVNSAKEKVSEIGSGKNKGQSDDNKGKDEDGADSDLDAKLKGRINGAVNKTAEKANEKGKNNKDETPPTLTQEQQDALATVGASLKNGKNPTQAVQQMQIDNAVKKAETTTALTSIPATVSALSSDGQPVVNNNGTSSAPAPKGKIDKSSPASNATITGSVAGALTTTATLSNDEILHETNNNKTVKPRTDQPTNNQPSDKEIKRQNRQAQRDANRQAREEARAKKKEEKNNAPKPENNNTNTNSNTTTGNNNTAPAPKPSEPATPSTTTATNAVTAAATTATVATTPTPKAKPETNTVEITPAEKSTKKQTNTDRSYQIPINERPTITSNETDCDRLSEQAVYCFAISNQTSDCKNSFTVQHLIEVSVKQEYRNARISPDSQNATQTYWESKDQVLPSIKQYCRTHIMDLDKHNANASKTYQESVIIDPTLPKPTKKNSLSKNTSSKQKYTTKSECEAHINAGNTDDYNEVYNKRLQNIQNISVNVKPDHIVYIHNGATATQGKLVCRENAHTLKDCENASYLLPQTAAYQTLELLKEAYCNTTIDRGELESWVTSEENIHKRVY